MNVFFYLVENDSLPFSWCCSDLVECFDMTRRKETYLEKNQYFFLFNPIGSALRTASNKNEIFLSENITP